MWLASNWLLEICNVWLEPNMPQFGHGSSSWRGICNNSQHRTGVRQVAWGLHFLYMSSVAKFMFALLAP